CTRSTDNTLLTLFPPRISEKATHTLSSRLKASRRSRRRSRQLRRRSRHLCRVRAARVDSTHVIIHISAPLSHWSHISAPLSHWSCSDSYVSCSDSYVSCSDSYVSHLTRTCFSYFPQPYLPKRASSRA